MFEDQQLGALAALPVPLPPVSSNDVFTQDQWTTLLSICEVFVPSISAESSTDATLNTAIADLRNILPKDESDDLIKQYLTETVVHDAAFKESVHRRLVSYIPNAQVKGLAFLLSALNTTVGSLVMTGSTNLLHNQSLSERSRIVFGWAKSSLGPLRAFYQAVEGLTKLTWVSQSELLYRLLNYPKIPKDIERHPGYDFNFLDFASEAADKPVEVHADIVIVGSGCGAGVVAEHLSDKLASSKSKPRILVLEKSYHYPTTHFPMDQSAAGVHIQEGGGGILSDDGSIAVLAGSAFGGGGLINWSASLQPQHFVRHEWAAKHKLPFVRSEAFQACLDEVCDKMGVCRSTDHEGLSKIEQNFGNSSLLEASRRLGLMAEVVPQNTAGKRHYCGRCGNGCASATKQGPSNFWFPAAAEKGVEFIEGCFVESILWESLSPVRKARGLNAVWTSRDRGITRKLRIHAKHIIVSSGTLNSPLLLHRSGLTPEINKHIGSNLHLHPTLNVRATYVERVDPWDGAILTSAMTSLENQDGKGHGVKVEVMLGVPELTGAVFPFRPQLCLEAIASARKKDNLTNDVALASALDYKLRIAKHGYSFVYIAIQRDHADVSNPKKAYVYNDPADNRKVKINYTPSNQDRKCLLEGLITAARMHYVMGAETIEVNSPDINVFERPSNGSSSDHAAFEAWIAKIEAGGIALIDPHTTRCGSAHQMSTCRMSASPSEGVVNEAGKVWGTENVYVADASILPSASGVNPMISTMGFSLHVAKQLVAKIQAS